MSTVFHAQEAAVPEIVLKVSEAVKDEIIRTLIPSGTVFVTMSSCDEAVDFDAELFVPSTEQGK